MIKKVLCLFILLFLGAALCSAEAWRAPDQEKALKKAISRQPDNEWYLDELYEVYAQQNEFDKAIKTVKQLVKYHPDYKEDLAALYVRVKGYKEALKILDELDTEFGISSNRDILRNQV